MEEGDSSKHINSQQILMSQSILNQQQQLQSSQQFLNFSEASENGCSFLQKSQLEQRRNLFDENNHNEIFQIAYQQDDSEINGDEDNSLPSQNPEFRPPSIEVQKEKPQTNAAALKSFENPSLKYSFFSMIAKSPLRPPHMDDEGFSSELWQHRAMKIIQKVIYFSSQMLQLSAIVRFRILKKRQLQILNDVTTIDLNKDLLDEQKLQKKNLVMLEYFKSQQEPSVRKHILEILMNLIEKIPIITPDSYLKLIWDIFFMIFIIFKIMTIPMILAYDLESSFCLGNIKDNLCTQELISLVIMGIDIILCMNTAIFKQGTLLKSRMEVIRNYKESFFLDIFVLLTYLTGTLIQNNFFQLVIVIKLYDMVHIVMFMEEIFHPRQIVYSLIDIGKIIFILLFIAHMVSCFIFLISKDNHSEVTWISKLNYDSWPQYYLTGLYFAIITMITIGYGDVVPVTINEKVFVMSMTLVSCGVFAYSLNTISRIVSEFSQRKSKFRKKMINLNMHIESRGLNKQIAIKVRKYLEYIYKSTEQEEETSERDLQLIPQSLKDEVYLDIYGKLLKKSKMFSLNFSEKFLNTIALRLKETKYGPEEVIYHPNDQGSTLYFILKGVVELYLPVKNPSDSEFPIVSKLQKGENFGIYSFFSGKFRETGAISKQVTSVVMLELNDFIHTIKQFEDDYEIFCMMKDKVNLNNSTFGLDVKCKSCSKFNHQLYDCPLISYSNSHHFMRPKKQLVIARSNKSEPQLRQKSFERRGMRSLNSLVIFKYIRSYDIEERSVIDCKQNQYNQQKNDQNSESLTGSETSQTLIQLEDLAFDNNSGSNFVKEISDKADFHENLEEKSIYQEPLKDEEKQNITTPNSNGNNLLIFSKMNLNDNNKNLTPVAQIQLQPTTQQNQLQSQPQLQHPSNISNSPSQISIYSHSNTGGSNLNNMITTKQDLNINGKISNPPIPEIPTKSSEISPTSLLKQKEFIESKSLANTCQFTANQLKLSSNPNQKQIVRRTNTDDGQLQKEFPSNISDHHHHYHHHNQKSVQEQLQYLAIKKAKKKAKQSQEMSRSSQLASTNQGFYVTQGSVSKYLSPPINFNVGSNIQSINKANSALSQEMFQNPEEDILQKYSPHLTHQMGNQLLMIHQQMQAQGATNLQYQQSQQQQQIQQQQNSPYQNIPHQTFNYLQPQSLQNSILQPNQLIQPNQLLHYNMNNTQNSNNSKANNHNNNNIQNSLSSNGHQQDLLLQLLFYQQQYLNLVNGNLMPSPNCLNLSISNAPQQLHQQQLFIPQSSQIPHEGQKQYHKIYSEQATKLEGIGDNQFSVIFDFDKAKMFKRYLPHNNLDKVLNRYRYREIRRKRTAIKAAGIQNSTPSNKIIKMSLAQVVKITQRVKRLKKKKLLKQLSYSDTIHQKRNNNKFKERLSVQPNSPQLQAISQQINNSSSLFKSYFKNNNLDCSVQDNNETELRLSQKDSKNISQKNNKVINLMNCQSLITKKESVVEKQNKKEGGIEKELRKEINSFVERMSKFDGSDKKFYQRGKSGESPKQFPNQIKEESFKKVSEYHFSDRRNLQYSNSKDEKQSKYSKANSNSENRTQFGGIQNTLREEKE